VGKIVMDNVSGNGCCATYSIPYSVDRYDGNGRVTEILRDIPDYNKNYLFKGISKNEIESNNCTWEKCCNLVGEDAWEKCCNLVREDE
jgi:hypothetical protein